MADLEWDTAAALPWRKHSSFGFEGLPTGMAPGGPAGNVVNNLLFNEHEEGPSRRSTHSSRESGVVSATASNVSHPHQQQQQQQHSRPSSMARGQEQGLVQDYSAARNSTRVSVLPSDPAAASAAQLALSRRATPRNSVVSQTQSRPISTRQLLPPMVLEEGQTLPPEPTSISVDIIHSTSASHRASPSPFESGPGGSVARRSVGSFFQQRGAQSEAATAQSELSMVAMAAALASAMATNESVLVEARDENMSVQVQAGNNLATAVTTPTADPNPDTTLALPAPATEQPAVSPARAAAASNHSSDETADDDLALDDGGDTMGMDAPQIRQLTLVVGQARPSRMASLYLPEDVFTDTNMDATVQQRGEGYQTAQPTSAAVYNERRRRNSLDSEPGSTATNENDNFTYNTHTPYARTYVPPPKHPYVNNDSHALQAQPQYLPVGTEAITVDMPRAPSSMSYGAHAGAARSPRSEHGGGGDKTKGKDKDKQKERPPELIGARDFRRALCTWLIAPLLCCFPFDRTKREARAFFLYYLICNIGFFLAIVLVPDNSTMWVVAVLAIPTVMAIIRFSAAVLARVAGVKVEYSFAMKGHVVMMVPCYTEGREGLEATLDSMAASDLRGLTGTIVAICDGRVIGVGSTESCEECLTSMMTVKRTTVYKDYTEYAGTYKGMAMFVIGKHQNAGKRDSQIRVFNLVNQGRFGQVDYIFMTDADCYFPKDSVYELCWRLYHEKDTYAACGDIRVADPKNILSKGQTYEYFLSQFHSRVAESYFATVTCLPGAFVCITTDVLSPELIKLYSAEPNSLHTAQLLKLGEDRYMTSIFMKLFPRRRAVFLPEAVLHTGVPETTTILKSQRRRWCMSAFHNMFDNLFLPRLFLWTRVCLVYDLITTWFQVTFFLLIFYSIARIIVYGNTMDYISVGAGMGFILMTMFTAGVYDRWEVLRYVPHFMLMTPMLYLVIPISNAWNAGNVKWGKTRQVSSIASSAAGDGLLEPGADGSGDRDRAPGSRDDALDSSSHLGVGRVVDDDDDDRDHDFDGHQGAGSSYTQNAADDLAWDFEAEAEYAQRSAVRGALPGPPEVHGMPPPLMHNDSEPAILALPHEFTSTHGPIVPYTNTQGLRRSSAEYTTTHAARVPALGLPPTDYGTVHRSTMHGVTPHLVNMSAAAAARNVAPRPASAHPGLPGNAPARGAPHLQSTRSMPGGALKRQASRTDRFPQRPFSRPGLAEDAGYDPRIRDRGDAASFKSGMSERKVVLTSGVSFTDINKAFVPPSAVIPRRD